MNEAETIRRCQRGDNQAFADLISGYRDGAYRYCVGMVGSSQTARDIVQEGFLAAFRGIARLDPERGFGGWFYGILRHFAYATLRQGRIALDPDLLEQTADPHPSPESRAASGERSIALARCLGQLTSKQREVIVLRELEGLSYKEIAARLDAPIGTVMSRLYDARHALRAAMAADPTFAEELSP